MRDPCGDGTVLYLECGAYVGIKFAYTHTHKWVEVKMGGLYWCQYPGCDILALEDATIGGNWEKSTRDPSVLFPTTAYEKSQNKKFHF